MTSSIAWPCSVAVDVGGTFTDVVVVDASATVSVAKVPTVPLDPSVGVLDAVAKVAADHGVEVGTLMARCHRFVHGSTVATNAVLEEKLAVVGLLTTEGFRDSLEIRRGIRRDQWDHREPWPEVLVPRHLRLGVGGRLDRNGTELEPLDLEAVEHAMGAFGAGGVEAVAICLLHSYTNPIHERRVAEMVRTVWPGALTTVSSDLVPLLGEYERTSTTVVNAGLVPKVGGYLVRLADALGELGLRSPLLLLQSNGGTVPLDAVASRPVHLALSGPAAVGGALRHLGLDASESVISMEIGGTSCDVAVMVDGEVPVIDGLEVGGRHLNIPTVDVHTIGAGGGTIASVDEAGLLVVGPRGAGADPGPAGYGRGGEEPTATDAHLMLGRLRPGSYAGGSVVLREDLAHIAMETYVASRLGIGAEDAAIGVLSVLEQHLIQAVETITIERGRDPGQMTMVAAGGAGGLHGSSVASSLGCRRLLIPAEGGVFCAVGMLHSPLRRDLARTLVGRLDEIGAVGVLNALADTEAVVRDLVAEEWPTGSVVTTRHHVDIRYPGQLWSVRVDVDGAVDTPTIRHDFEAEYQRLFGHIQPEGILDVTSIGVTATAALEVLVHSEPTQVESEPTTAFTRRCWVDATSGWCDVDVYGSASLAPGDSVKGPFIIEAETTTILGRNGDLLRVLGSGDFEIELT